MKKRFMKMPCEAMGVMIGDEEANEGGHLSITWVATTDIRKIRLGFLSFRNVSRCIRSFSASSSRV